MNKLLKMGYRFNVSVDRIVVNYDDVDVLVYRYSDASVEVKQIIAAYDLENILKVIGKWVMKNEIKQKVSR